MKTLAGALMLLCLPVVAAAQVDRATLSGVVRDASGAIVPKATVALTHFATNLVTRATATEDGAFLALDLAPGQYLAEAQAPGFQKTAQTIILEVGQRARLEFTLSVGGVNETITVAGVSPLLDSESAVLGTVVGQHEISKLPLAIRNWDDLLALVAGVQGDRYTEESGGTSTGRTGGVNVHGSRSLQNNFLLDGVDNNSISTNVQELSTQVSRPSIDAINEFKVVTSPYAAEYGRSPGGTISVTTKGGTNSLRGTAYEFFRNDRFDSTTFFANRAKLTKPKNDQNQFGGNLGGPILKNRAFFFGDVEATRITKGVLRLNRVATAEERAGLFSRAITDPATGLPFPGNQIPAARIDPVATRILNLVPLPNTTGTNNYIRQPNVEDAGERYLGRVDVRLSDNDNLFGRYIYSDRFRYVPGFLGGLIDGSSTSAWGRNFLKSHAAVFGYTKVLGNALVNEFRFSWSRGLSNGTQDPFGQDGFDQIGFKGVPRNPIVAGGIVGVDISGHVRLGSPNFMPKFQHTDQFQYRNTLSWLRGSHQLKFGTDVMAPMKNDYLDVAPTRGFLDFSGQFTDVGLADFLLGYVRQAQLTNVYVVNQRRWSTGFFVQDDWKVTDRLALNLGLRYDFMTPSLDAQNRQTNFDQAAGALVFAKDGSLKARALVQPDTNNFGPRLGVVYKVNGTTVLRGGYGMFFNLFERIGSEDQLALNPPGLTNIDLNTSSRTAPVFFLRDGFREGILDPRNVNLGGILIRAADAASPNMSTHQFGGGVEKQMGAQFVVSADVVGAVGRNLAVLRNLNQPLGGNGPRPYPGFGHIQFRDHSGESSYKGLDVTFEKRFANGYGYRAAYTLSESRDQAPEHLAASSGRPQNSLDLSAWEGPSDFDVRHRVIGTLVAELPFGAGKRWAADGPAAALLGGWTVSGIYTAHTGRPFTVTQGSNNVGPGATGLPNRTGDGKGPEDVNKWFDAAAFTAVPTGTFGNSGRNILRGPGWVTFDTSLQRRIAIYERVAATLRWDVFNVLDRANFGLPDANINSATVGTITTLAGDPRIMQFSVRLEF